MNTQLKINKNGVMELFRGEHSLVCPFKNSFPSQNSFGQIQFIGQSCNSLCPHFFYEKRTGSEIVDISCSGSSERVFTNVISKD